MDILTRENLSSIKVANMDLIYSSLCSFSTKEGDGVRAWMGRKGIFKPAGSITFVEYM